MYRVLLLDGDSNARFGLRRFPWGRYGFELTGEATGGREALVKLETSAFDLLVTDIRLTDMEGSSFLKAVQSMEGHPCIVLLSSCNDFEYAQQAIGLGVFDYMTKPLSVPVFSGVLQRAGIYLSRRRLELTESEPQETAPATISVSEQDAVVRLLLEGDSAFEGAVLDIDRSLSSLSAEQRGRQLGNLLDKAERELWLRYPWVGALESRQAAPDSVMQRATQLSGIVKRFELAQEKSLLRSICRLAYQHIEENLSLRGVAEELDISPDYAGRIFKRKTSLSFVTFVTRMKMERGKQLLEEGSCRNYEISARLGYSNPDYFRQLFKAHTGMTPTEYRTLCRRQVFA